MMFSEVYILWRREIKKALADRTTLLISAVWPLFLIFILGIGFDSFVELKGIGTSYTEFLGPGIIAIMAMSGAVYVGDSIIKDKEGFIKELLVAPISRGSIFVGKILGVMTISITIMALVVMVFLEAIGKLSVAPVLWSLVFMFLIAFVFYGASLTMGFLFRRAGSFQQVAALLSFVITFLSGAFFPINELPAWMKAVAYANPLTYGVDGLRGQLVGNSAFPVVADLMVLSVFALVTVCIGAASFRKVVESD